MSEKDKDLATVERTIEILEQWNMDPMMGTWYATNSETVRSILGALDAAQEVAARHRFPNQEADFASWQRCYDYRTRRSDAVWPDGPPSGTRQRVPRRHGAGAGARRLTG